MTTFLQYLISGLAVGAVYGLVALGFVLIFKSTQVFNFAQGDFLTVGGYSLFVAMSALGLPLLASIVAALGFMALFGFALQLTLFRSMVGKPLLTIVMVTIALSMIIRAIILIIFGPTEQSLPSRLPNSSFSVAGVEISVLDLIIIAAAAVCLVAFALFFLKSRIGLQMRATAENPEAAVMSGIDSGRVFRVAFAIGCLTAGIGGILVANLQVVSPNLSAVGLLALPAAVVGGLSSISGSIVGGLIIGVIQQLAIGYAGGRQADLFVYGALLLLLLVRPYGLFGRPTVARV